MKKKFLLIVSVALILLSALAFSYGTVLLMTVTQGQYKVFQSFDKSGSCFISTQVTSDSVRVHYTWYSSSTQKDGWGDLDYGYNGGVPHMINLPFLAPGSNVTIQVTSLNGGTGTSSLWQWQQ